MGLLHETASTTQQASSAEALVGFVIGILLQCR